MEDAKILVWKLCGRRRPRVEIVQYKPMKYIFPKLIFSFFYVFYIYIEHAVLLTRQLILMHVKRAVP